jgi:hypothetical protein
VVGQHTNGNLKETKMKLQANTPVGTFSRETKSQYKAIVVWNSPRAKACFDKAQQTGIYPKSGVDTRWVKDNGFAVTWHGSKASALKATKNYLYDGNATVAGVFEL